MSTDMLIKATETLQDYQFGSMKPVKFDEKKRGLNFDHKNLESTRLSQLQYIEQLEK